MATFRKNKLSASTNGRAIKIAATSSPGTTLHTAVTGTSDWDEVWIWAVNTDTTPRKVTIEYGGTTSPDDLIEVTIAAESGLALIVPGLILQNGSVVKAFAATADVVNCHGYVNRITA